MNFPVALFFFISGYFTKNPLNMVRKSGGYWKHRILRLLIPYFIWSFIYIAMRFINGENFGIHKILITLITGSAVVPLYYILVLLLFTIITPVLFWSMNNKIADKIILAVSPTFLVVAFFFLFCFKFNFWDYLKYTPIWLLFFYLGIRFKEKKPKLNVKYLYIALIAMFALQLLETVFLRKIAGFNAFTQIRFFGFGYSLVLIMLIYEKSKKSSRKVNLLVRIGDDSFGIYFIHCAFLMVFSKLYPMLGIDIPLIVLQPIEIIVTLALSLLSVYLIRIAFKEKLSALLFGV